MRCIYKTEEQEDYFACKGITTNTFIPSSVMLKKFSLPETSEVVEDAELTAACKVKQTGKYN